MTLKEKIIAKLLERAKEDLVKAESACEASTSLRDSDDLKQESKYDTRAVEASYLVGAQRKRVEELKLEVGMIEELPMTSFFPDQEVAIGALVELKHNNITQYYFVSSTAGGSMLKIDDRAILVISVFSPIGNEVIGLKVGENFELETPKGIKEYQITSIA